ncbi:winged helix-turn-helix domain-containing protein [Micromonospora zamorensis]|uniref:winged helix-turn-helix domain-containing protein n=1 Tax=Micromonospora zamorensis TaxID=709883 RepID=UPI003CEF8D11
MPGSVDARWTLTRVAKLIERRIGVVFTLRGMSYVAATNVGYSLQVAARRTLARPEWSEVRA